MTERGKALSTVSRMLGRLDLVWGGLRSDDIEALSDLPQLATSFAIVGGHDRGGAVPSLDFEDLWGARPDLDAWDIEDHHDSAASREFRERMLHRLATPSALLPYRPSSFLSSIAFARRDSCRYLGLFSGHQAMFEHKPWVESALGVEGVDHVPWVYVADEDKNRVLRVLREGPVMLRVSRSSGGAGLTRVEHSSELAARWPVRAEGLVSVAPYLSGALPINIGATVWRDGVTMRHPSVQLIGVPELTMRPFGYTGNDFGMARNLEPRVVDALEKSVSAIGNWLRRYGYIGSFGVDYLVHKGKLLFTEVNARFQGSTHASSQLSGEAGESCLFLDHIAASLGCPAPPMPPLVSTIRKVPDFAHIVVHWPRSRAVVDVGPLAQTLRTADGSDRVDTLTKPSLVTETGAPIVRATVRRRLTRTGYELCDPWRSIIADWMQGTSGLTETTPERKS